MKPINMKTWEVQAILDNRKTVTRRVVKPKPLWQKPPVQQKRYLEYWGNWDDPQIYKAPCRPGDTLYVREPWTQDGDVYRYKAGFYDQNRKWRPSIHMPREAARIFLRVTNVQVERLQDISDEQAEKEGCNGEFIGTGEALGSGWAISPTEEFAELWDGTLKPKGRAIYGWEANPWVWVVEFERMSEEEALCPPTT